MILIYTPADGERREWRYTFDDLPYEEAELVEETLGDTFDEWRNKVTTGSARARRALLWVFLRREQPSLKFADVKLGSTGELSNEFDSDEKRQILAELDKVDDSNLSAEERQQRDVARALLEDTDEPQEPETPKDASSG